MPLNTIKSRLARLEAAHRSQRDLVDQTGIPSEIATMSLEERRARIRTLMTGLLGGAEETMENRIQVVGQLANKWGNPITGLAEVLANIYENPKGILRTRDEVRKSAE